jgi:hypothetical protein
MNVTNAITTIRQLADICRRYDPDFDKDEFLYRPDAFKLSLEGVPEAEVEAIAAAFGATLRRAVDFSVGFGGCPTVRPSAHIHIGRLTVFLLAPIRRATPAEIEDTMDEIRKKVESCSKPTTAIE